MSAGTPPIEGKPLSRRQALRIGLGAVVATLATAACGQASSPASSAAEAAPSAEPSRSGAKVVMDANPIMATLSWVVGNDEGIFKKEGVDFELTLSFQPSTLAIQRLTGGSQTLSETNPSAALANAILRGAEIIIVGGNQVVSSIAAGSKLLVNSQLYDSGVRKTADLKGMEINIPFGLDSGFGRWSVEIFRKYGLDPFKDVKITGWNDQGQLQAALSSGTAKVGVVGEPGATVLIQKGDVKPIDDSAIEIVLDGEVSTMILMSRAFVEKNPEATIRTLKARQRAVLLYEESRASKWEKNPAFRKAMRERLKLTDDVIDHMSSGNWFPSDGLFDVGKAQDEFDFFQQMANAKEKLQLSKYLDFKYMNEAVKRLKAEGLQIPPDPYVKS